MVQYFSGSGSFISLTDTPDNYIGAANQVVVVNATATGVTFVNQSSIVTDHGILLGLSDDDHTQYALLAGRSGGQTLTGGTASADDLTLISTSDATKGSIIVQDELRINQYIDLDEIVTPANPSTDVGRLYVADDAGTTTLFFRDSAGTETNLLGPTPGGADTNVQFNNAGAFGGDSNFVWDNTNKRLGVGVTPLESIHTAGSFRSDAGIYVGSNSKLDLVYDQDLPSQLFRFTNAVSRQRMQVFNSSGTILGSINWRNNGQLSFDFLTQNEVLKIVGTGTDVSFTVTDKTLEFSAIPPTDAIDTTVVNYSTSTLTGGGRLVRYQNGSTDVVVVRTTGAIEMIGNIQTQQGTPTQITADQGAFDFGDVGFARISSDATRTINGLDGTRNGRQIDFVNVGSNNIIFAHDSASATSQGVRLLTVDGNDLTVGPEESIRLIYDDVDSRWRVVNINTDSTVVTTRVTSSPYSVLGTDDNIFVDTDSAAITVNLPAGIDGTNYRIINTGSSGNNVTISPNGAELLLGSNSSITLLDGDAVILVYETTEGWW